MKVGEQYNAIQALRHVGDLLYEACDILESAEAWNRDEISTWKLRQMVCSVIVKVDEYEDELTDLEVDG